MPELPDLTVYCEALERFYAGSVLERIELKSPFLLRTFEPDLFLAEGKRLESVERLGKRIVFCLGGEMFLVFHLMIAGRFHRRPAGAQLKGKHDLMALHFRIGQKTVDTLALTEASANKRASLHAVEGRQHLTAHDPGGAEPLQCDLETFRRLLTQGNHTLKRTLTDPQLFSGIGNAYSDEILHAAQLSPILLTARINGDEIARLHVAMRKTLDDWTSRLREQVGERFPEHVTAFRPEMAVHGRLGLPCPACQTPVQRIRYVDNETNYCPRCQTGGKILADRSLSRLLKDDWPRSIEQWENS